MRSVVVAKYVPWPPNSGDKRRTLAMVRALASRGEVTVCAFAGADEDAAPLEAEGIRVRQVPLRRSLAHLANGLVRSRSLSSARFWSTDLAALVAEERADADLLLVEHAQLLPYADHAARHLTVVDMHNVESSLTRRYADSQRGLKRAVLTVEAKLLRSLEKRAAAADAVVVVSDGDARLLADGTGISAVVVPNAWDTPRPLPPAPDPVVAFVALLSWAPNVDAATWFCREVWPAVVARLPAARLVLVGRNPAPAVRELSGPTVHVTGTVADLEPWYARARVTVAPLRSGGGSRLKILEALAFGRPVISTTVGAEGLEDLIGRGVVVADGAADFAASLATLLADPARSESLGEAGSAAVAEHHTWDTATQPLLELLDERVAGSVR